MSDIEIGSVWVGRTGRETVIISVETDDKAGDIVNHRKGGCLGVDATKKEDFLNKYEPKSEFFKRQDKEDLKISPAMIRGIHPYSFRSGEWATIVGLVVCGKDYPGGRLNYMVMFDDGTVDYWPVCDESNHEIKAASEVSK